MVGFTPLFSAVVVACLSQFDTHVTGVFAGMAVSPDALFGHFLHKFKGYGGSV